MSNIDEPYTPVVSPEAQHAHIVVDDPGHARSPWWALVVVCFAQFMVVLDATITNVALPTIQRKLEITPSDLQWVINSYTLAFGGLLLLGGRASDLIGRRKIFVAGTLLFSVASLCNGLATSSEMLIIFRGIQGVGAAMISPAALSVIMTSFSEGEERTKALGVWSAIAAGGAALGLLLGGVITQAFDWPWIFYINVPVGIAVIAAAFRWVPESHADLGHRRFDIGGAVTVTAGLMLLVYTIVNTLQHDFFSSWILTRFAIAIALLIAFVVIEAVSAAPLVRLGLLRVRSLWVSNASMLIVSAGMFAFFYFATLYIQQVLGYKPIRAGAAFLPFALGIGVGAGSAQVAIKSLGVRITGFTGLIIAGAGLCLMAASVKTDGSYWPLLAGMILMSIGLGWTFVPFTLIATTNVADEEAGLASGIFNTSQQIGGAVGLAILSTIANNVQTGKLDDIAGHPSKLQALDSYVSGYQAAMFSGVAFMAVAFAVTLLFLRRRDVASIDTSAPATMHA